MAVSERFAEAKARLRVQMAAMEEQDRALTGQRGLIKQVCLSTTGMATDMLTEALLCTAFAVVEAEQQSAPLNGLVGPIRCRWLHLLQCS